MSKLYLNISVSYAKSARNYAHRFRHFGIIRSFDILRYARWVSASNHRVYIMNKVYIMNRLNKMHILDSLLIFLIQSYKINRVYNELSNVQYIKHICLLK